MTNETTPLQQLQNEVADYLDPWNMTAITRTALDAFLVQAFDLGVTAQRELAEGAVPAEPSPERASFDAANRRLDAALEKMVRKD